MQAVRVRWGKSAVAIAAVAAGLIGSGMVVWQGSRAAFSGTTENAGNNWTSGTVALTNNRGAAMFSASSLNIKPDDPHQRCIEVTYTGNLAANVHLYSALYTDTGLGPYLNLKIEEGTGGVFGDVDCTNASGFAVDAGTGLIWDGSLANHNVADFAGKTNFAGNIGTWGPTAANQKKVYRFTYELKTGAASQATMDGLQNKSCQIKFIWEAQNT